MRIAFVTTEFVSNGTFYGGLANYVYKMVTGLRALGHEPVVIVASNQNTCYDFENIAVHEVDISPGRIVLFINKLTRDYISVFCRLAWQSLTLNRAVKRLHARTPFAAVQYTNQLGIAAFRPAGITTIVRVSSDFSLLHKNGDYASAHKRFIRQMVLAEKWGTMRADTVFGPSTIIAQHVSAKIRKPVEIISSPVLSNVGPYDESVYNTCLPGKQYLLFVGRLCKLKGTLVIAEIIYRLLAEHAHLHFVFCGRDDHAPNAPSVIAFVLNKAGVHKERVIYIGKIQHQHLFPVIDRAHAVVLPSLVDNFPNTCIEAMMRHKVVIGTKGTGGFDDIIINDENGLLCSPDDPESLMQTITKALTMPKPLLDIMGEKAFESAQRFSLEKVCRQHVEYYSKVCAKKMRHRC